MVARDDICKPKRPKAKLWATMIQVTKAIFVHACTKGVFFVHESTIVLFCVVAGYGPLAKQVEHFGLDLGDGMSHLLDLRFADDILLFGEINAGGLQHAW